MLRLDFIAGSFPKRTSSSELAARLESRESCARFEVWRELCNRCVVIRAVGIGNRGVGASGLVATTQDTSLHTLKNLLIPNLFVAHFLCS